MKKHKVSKAKPKKFNFKMLLAGLALFLAVGGYALYRNSVEIPSINLADGLEAEEANFLKKTVKTGTGVVKAPLVKVTVQNAAKQDVTSTIRLNPNPKVDKNATEKEVKAAVEDIKTEVLANGIATNTQTGTVEQKILNEDEKNKIKESGITLAQSPVTPESNLQSAAICSTNGAPVTYGTWVSTGDAYGDNKEGRKCVMCGEKGYEVSNAMDCRDVMAQGKPIVLPTGGGLAYTGYKEEISSCIGKKDGSFINIAVGQKGDAGYCGPDGKISSETDAKTKLNEYCAKIKTNSTWDGSKCAEKPPATGNNSGSDNSNKTCEPPLILTADGKCLSQKFIDAQKASDAKAKADADAKALAMKELASAAAKKSYPGKTECDKAIVGTTTLECYVTGPIGSQTFAVRAKSASSVTLISCPMENKNLKNQMIDIKLGCGALSGAVAAIEARNIKNPDGTLTGGETTSDPKDCKFGGSPPLTTDGKKLALGVVCNDSTGKPPANNTSTTSNGNQTSNYSNDTNVVKADLERNNAHAGEDCGVLLGAIGKNNCRNVCPRDADGNVIYGEYDSSTNTYKCGTSTDNTFRAQNPNGVVGGLAIPSECKYPGGVTDRSTGKTWCPDENGYVPKVANTTSDISIPAQSGVRTGGAAATVCVGALLVAGALLPPFAWGALPACALIGTGAGLWDYQASRPVSPPVESELNTNPINQATKEQVHIENLQTKYELIIEKNPEAFTKYGRELGMQDCINNYSVAECIPIPGKNNKAVVEHAIDEAANLYNINLP